MAAGVPETDHPRKPQVRSRRHSVVPLQPWWPVPGVPLSPKSQDPDTLLRILVHPCKCFCPCETFGTPTSLMSWAPAFSKGSSRVMARAMDTPSLMTWGTP